MTDDGGRMTEDRRKMTGDGPQSPVTGLPAYKFQSLQVYQLALDYFDRVYDFAHNLPEVEKSMQQVKAKVKDKAR